MSGGRAWMPLYVGDYLGDTEHLTIEQSGSYLHLLMYSWRTARLPDDDASLARLCRVSVTYWRRHIRSAVVPMFTAINGILISPRLERERERIDKNSRCQTQKIVKRWSRKTAPESGENKDLGPAPVSVRYSSGNTSHNHNHNQRSKKEERKAKSASADPSLNLVPAIAPMENSQVVEAWNQMATEARLPLVKAMTPRRLRELQLRLRDHGPYFVIAAIAQIGASAFCRGQNDRGWRADFDFLLQPQSLIRAAEGRYADHKQQRDKSVHQQVREAGDLPTFLGSRWDDDEPGTAVAVLP